MRHQIHPTGDCVIGTLRFPPTADLVRSLRDRFNLNVCIEGGTYHGEGTSFAAEEFEKVITIDIREDYQNVGKARCTDFDNITYLLGDTRTVLPSVIAALTGPALFWLDAHSVAGMFGPKDDCPILEELDMINASPFKHFVLIDDAHCFKPPVPHNAAVWPEIWELEEKAAIGGYLMWEAHDVLVIASYEAKPQVDVFTGETPDSNVAHATITIKPEIRKPRPTNFTARGVAVQGLTLPPTTVSFTELVETAYGKMLVPRYDTNQTPPLRSGHALDHGNIELLAELLEHRKPGAVFLDIGANVGAFSFALRPLCAKVHAFEAQRLIYNMLCGSVALNGWENVFCYHSVVSDSFGLIEAPQFDYSASMSFGSIEFGKEQKEQLTQFRTFDPNKVEYVDAMPLDHFLFTRVDMIKIDVEGFEHKVLEGAKQTIDMYRPIMFIEHTKCHSVKLKQQILDIFPGYKIRDCGSDFLVLP